MVDAVVDGDDVAVVLMLIYLFVDDCKIRGARWVYFVREFYVREGRRKRRIGVDSEIFVHLQECVLQSIIHVLKGDETRTVEHAMRTWQPRMKSSQQTGMNRFFAFLPGPFR